MNIKYDNYWNILADSFRWAITDEVSNGAAYIESKYSGLLDVSETGWQYWDDGMHDDETMRVTGKNIFMHSGNIIWYLYNITEGEPSYPDTLRVSSSSITKALSFQYMNMGSFSKTTQTHDGRPVWKMKVYPSPFYPFPDVYASYFYYNGKIVK